MSTIYHYTHLAWLLYAVQTTEFHIVALEFSQSLKNSTEKPHSPEGLSNTSNKAIRFPWLQLQQAPVNFICKQPLLKKKEMQS